MATTVDVRGLACPQPVIQTRKAMQKTNQIVTLVDNETAVSNVSRMAARAGWQVEVQALGEEFRIEIVQDEARAEAVVIPEPEALAASTAGAHGSPLVLVVSSDTMGRGDAQLGNILIRGFFHSLGEIDAQPKMIIFLNSGVKLVCEGSPVVDDLQALEKQGVEILACGTCLDYFELGGKLKAGQVSNMYDIAESMLGAGKVVNL